MLWKKCLEEEKKYFQKNMLTYYVSGVAGVNGNTKLLCVSKIKKTLL